MVDAEGMMAMLSVGRFAARALRRLKYSCAVILGVSSPGWRRCGCVSWTGWPKL